MDLDLMDLDLMDLESCLIAVGGGLLLLVRGELLVGDGGAEIAASSFCSQSCLPPSVRNASGRRCREAKRIRAKKAKASPKTAASALMTIPAMTPGERILREWEFCRELDADALLLIDAARLNVAAMLSLGVSDGLELLLIVADGLMLPVGLPGGVRLLVGVAVGASEHWESPTVHETVALGLTVQLVVTKAHTVAEGIESKTHPEMVNVPDEDPLTRKSTELPRNRLAEQVHGVAAQRRPG
jgi:hypothetical protein